jgi:hypothetical protein
MSGKKLVSLGDLRKESEKPEDKKRNTLYTGGANSGSGQNVIGPRTLSHDDDDDEDGDDDEGGGDGRSAVDRVFRQQGVGGAWRRAGRRGGCGGGVRTCARALCALSPATPAAHARRPLPPPLLLPPTRRLQAPARAPPCASSSTATALSSTTASCAAWTTPPTARS